LLWIKQRKGSSKKVADIWKIKIHKLVFSEDFPSLNPPEQKIILKDIRKKLGLAPKDYGKALTGDLKGYWRLRVKDYRVIYKIRQEVVEVLVVKVGARRDDKVYQEMLLMLKRLSGLRN
jgi:mRNA interferase RelE/StbE